MYSIFPIFFPLIIQDLCHKFVAYLTILTIKRKRNKITLVLLFTIIKSPRPTTPVAYQFLWVTVSHDVVAEVVVQERGELSAPHSNPVIK